MFGGGNNSSMRNVYEIELGSAKYPELGHFSVELSEVPTICVPLARPSVPSHVIENFGHLQLADDYGENREFCVEILIGLDLLWSITSEKIEKFGSVVTQDTVFGWVLLGQSSRPLGLLMCLHHC